jgi:hypothetical protein
VRVGRRPRRSVLPASLKDRPGRAPSRARRAKEFEIGPPPLPWERRDGDLRVSGLDACVPRSRFGCSAGPSITARPHYGLALCRHIEPFGFGPPHWHHKTFRNNYLDITETCVPSQPRWDRVASCKNSAATRGDPFCLPAMAKHCEVFTPCLPHATRTLPQRAP